MTLDALDAAVVQQIGSLVMQVLKLQVQKEELQAALAEKTDVGHPDA
jgi:hypothetical protein